MTARAGLLLLFLSVAFPFRAQAQSEPPLQTPHNRADPGVRQVAAIEDAASLAGAWRVEGADCVLVLRPAEDARGAIEPSPDCGAPWAQARLWRASRFALQIKTDADELLWGGLHLQDGSFRGRGAVLRRAAP